jgi:glyoxylase-like metal-dependent hydrolase (beta-lactamase superfamily II)
MRQVANGIYYDNSYPGVTLGTLISQFGIIVIDAPLRPEDSHSWHSMLMSQRGWHNRLLINLDAHPDRTLGVRVIESTIIAHQNSVKIFEARPTIFKGLNADSGSVWEAYNDVIGIRWAKPDITFSGRMNLYWGENEIILEHHYGPTSEAIWVIIPEEQVIFVGDAVLINQPPFLAHADLVAWIDDLDLLLTSYRDFTVISGRGGLVDRKIIQAQKRIIKSVLRGMEKSALNNSPPEALEKMALPLLKRIKYPKEWHERYKQRLRYGLYHCYINSYQPKGQLEIPNLKE